MAFLKVENVAIRGISACVPPIVEENKDLPFYENGEAEIVIEKMGIERRHIVSKETTASDLCFKAADKLILDLGWDKHSIDLLAFVTQNPDYINHPTSFVVHEKLNLPESTMCVDFYHGCPGWIVSLSSILPMVSSGYIRRAILLDGDTLSKDQNKANREERPLFGDAGTATAIEFCEGAPEVNFYIGTKSDDGRALAKQNGGYRHPFTLETLKERLDALAGITPPEKIADKMDSMDVFSFAISKVPKAIKKLIGEFEISVENVDNLILHQANKMIVETIAKRLKFPMKKVPLGMKNYGNTSSASIPLAIVTECADKFKTDKQVTIACSFGTGLSWGVIEFETNKICVPDIIIY